MNLETASRDELITLVHQQALRIEVLENEIANLKEQLGLKTGKLSTPDFVKLNVKQKKAKKKRKQRTEAFVRRREEPDEIVFHTAKDCPDCGSKLGKPVVAYTRQVIDVPQVQYKVTEHVVCKRWCPKCRKRKIPTVNFGQLGKSRIGNHLTAMVATLRNRLRLPIGVIQAHLEIVYQLKLSEGELVQLLHRVGEVGTEEHGNLLEQIRGSPNVHADETSGREDGENGWFWSFSTDRVHYLMYRKSRSKKVVEEMVGAESEKFEGVLTTDFYAAYNTYLGYHQRCWVHLQRDMKDLQKENPKHPPLNVWCKKVRDLLYEAKAYDGPSATLPKGLQEQEREKEQRGYQDRLERICKPYLTKEAPMSTLCARLLKYLPEMFTFIRIPEVIPDNNPAERILRHMVVSRKISGGTRSAKGSRTKEILSSLFDTWRLQKKNPLQECQLLLASCQ